VTAAIADELRTVAIANGWGTTETPNSLYRMVGNNLSIHPLRQKHLRGMFSRVSVRCRAHRSSAPFLSVVVNGGTIAFVAHSFVVVAIAVMYQT
jgi:hypothetical protein